MLSSSPLRNLCYCRCLWSCGLEIKTRRKVVGAFARAEYCAEKGGRKEARLYILFDVGCCLSLGGFQGFI
jgi:hypothetical protein